jgi:HlyD family secretion protein
MIRRRSRKWPWVLLLLGGLAAGGWWWHSSRETKAPGPEYETTTATVGDLTRTVLASGELNPLAKVEIGSQISGTIWKLNVDFNSKVREGDILCQLDPATYEAAYSQTLAEQASAQAELELQQRTLERKLQLLQKDFFAKADFDKAQADLRRAEAQLQLATARAKKAKIDLDRCTIVAPIDGVVVDRTAEVGQTIAASFNAPKLFVLANDLTKMQINAKVSEAHVGPIENGQKVRFEVDAYPDIFQGVVVQVRNSPIKEETVVNYDSIISVDNPDLKLKPGMNAVVEIITGERKDVLKLANAAFRFVPPAKAAGGRRGPGGPPAPPAASPGQPRPKALSNPQAMDEKTVYFPPATPGGDPVPAVIKVGMTDGIHTEVLSGLKPGDVVITMIKPSDEAGPSMTNPFGGIGGGRRGPRGSR